MRFIESNATFGGCELEKCVLRIFAVLLLALASFVLPASAADKITIFAAASMKDVMDKVAPGYTEQTGIETVTSLASSSVLARQIEAGAPADIFISADKEWMDWMVEHDLVAAENVRIVAGNSLVIAVGKDSTAEADPEKLLSSGRFSMGDPAHVPAGRYGEAALKSLNLWDKVNGNAVYAENVRVALELANRGETQAAIVYATDAKAADMNAIYTFPRGSHEPVLYFAAPTKKAAENASTFLDYLMGQHGWAVLAPLGFVAPETTEAGAAK